MPETVPNCEAEAPTSVSTSLPQLQASDVRLRFGRGVALAGVSIAVQQGEIFEIIGRINQQPGTTILFVEQNARLALSLADFACLVENCRIVLDGEPDRLRDNEDIKELYLGLGEMGQRKSYRDVKHHKRRNCWLS